MNLVIIKNVLQHMSCIQLVASVSASKVKNCEDIETQNCNFISQVEFGKLCGSSRNVCERDVE